MPAPRVESPACTGGFVMPVLELSELITAIRGYGSGTANQKMVMKCMFGFLFCPFYHFLAPRCGGAAQCVSLRCFQGFGKEMRLCLQIIIAVLRGRGVRESNLYNPSDP